MTECVDSMHRMTESIIKCCIQQPATVLPTKYCTVPRCYWNNTIYSNILQYNLISNYILQRQYNTINPCILQY